MNMLLLLLSRESMWSPEIWASKHGGERGLGGQIVIEDPSGWLSILRDDLVLDDFDEGERVAVSTILADPVLFLVEWKGTDLLERMLQDVPLETGAIVDNDHGVLAPIRAIQGLPIDAWVRASKLPAAALSASTASVVLSALSASDPLHRKGENGT